MYKIIISPETSYDATIPLKFYLTILKDNITNFTDYIVISIQLLSKTIICFVASTTLTPYTLTT